MKSQENHTSKMRKKRALIIAGLCVVALGIGATIAVSFDEAFFVNLFHLNPARIVYTDEFVSPTQWQPCQDTEKHFTIKNESSLQVAVRFKMNQYWRKENSEISADDHETSELPMTFDKNGVESDMVIVNTLANSGWTYNPDDGYYYYNHDLEPYETTTSYIQSAMLDCSLNFGDNLEYTSDGTTITTESADSDYHNATFHIYIEGESIAASQVAHWDDKFEGEISREIAKKAIDTSGMTIDFKAPAVVSDDPEVANGNGVIPYTENGRTVYVYRGDIEDNYVLWSGYCWRIVRTTYSGGVKLVFNSAPNVIPAEVEGDDPTYQCDVGTTNAYLGQAPWEYYNGAGSPDSSSYIYRSPSDAGYMHGDRTELKQMSGNGLTNWTYSNDVRLINGIYYLDTSEGQSSTGNWGISSSTDVTNRMHYFCMGGAHHCDASEISYTFMGTIYYYPIGGYKNIDDFMANATAQKYPTDIKNVLDGLYTNDNGFMAANRDDLEDPVFCNDTRIAEPTSLLSKDNPAGPTITYQSQYNIQAEDYMPSLDCARKRDAYTMKDAGNGNTLLGGSVGMLTLDEVYLAGAPLGDVAGNRPYLLANSAYSWTMTPAYLNPGGTMIACYGSSTITTCSTTSLYGFRPVVSLKKTKRFAGGDGTATNPYTIQ